MISKFIIIHILILFIMSTITETLKNKIKSLEEDVHWLDHYNCILQNKLAENNIVDYDEPPWKTGELDKCECSMCFPSINSESCKCELCTGDYYSVCLEVSSSDISSSDVSSSDISSSDIFSSNVFNDSIDDNIDDFIKQPPLNIEFIANYVDLESSTTDECGDKCNKDCKNCLSDISINGYRRNKIINSIKTRLNRIEKIDIRSKKIKICEEIFLLLSGKDGLLLINKHEIFREVVKEKLKELYYQDELMKAYRWYRLIFGTRIP